MKRKTIEGLLDINPWIRAYGPDASEKYFTVEKYNKGKRNEILTGKWLIFASVPYFKEVWDVVKESTEEGLLGPSSKIANPDSHSSLVCCVYTKDYRDLEDVMRVRGKLFELGFKHSIVYKRDIDTLDGIYGSGASYYDNDGNRVVPGLKELINKGYTLKGVKDGKAVFVKTKAGD